MREALPQMIIPTEAQGSDSPEEHLHPADHRHYLPNDAVGEDEVATYAAMYSPFEMEFEVDTEDDLDDKKEHEDGGEGGVNVGSELATFVGVAEEVAEDGEKGANGLERHVPAGADNLEI